MSSPEAEAQEARHPGSATCTDQFCDPTGLRISEVVGLKTKDLRRDRERLLLEVRDSKGGKDRTIPLPDHTAETLETWLARRDEFGIGNGPVFCTIAKGRHVHPIATAEGLGTETTTGKLRPGNPINHRYVQQLVARLAERAGVEKRVTPHVLRHTAATLLLKGHRNLREVQEFLGHANVATTQVYTHVLAEDLAEAVDTMPDVEAKATEQEPEPDAETLQLAKALAALPKEQRAALASILADEEADD